MPSGSRSTRAPTPSPATRALVLRALKEDRAREDLTSRLLLPASLRVRATVTAQATGVLAGVVPAAETARQLGLSYRLPLRDGARVRSGTVVLELEGKARAMLAGERTLLNFLMHLSGVATATARAVERARRARPGFRVRGTRKTVPGLRELEKAAIESGGGEPHRADLASGLLVKNNHLALVRLEEGIRRARAGGAGPVQVEVRSYPLAARAIRAGADSLLLDNVGPTAARRILRRLRSTPGLRRVPVELSGGVTERRIAAFARTGAAAASLGALTHSAPAVPFHLTVRPVRRRPA
ncbi:MAG: carboxylating nicotinate-nucleotide diphosphorylase [Thermoplasmata archaeon]|nr:carboxylating nicotinate-nucleotide diphosphorylase [Thermoplasmata archaeon]